MNPLARRLSFFIVSASLLLASAADDAGPETNGKSKPTTIAADNYEQATALIRDELIALLKKRPVLVVWCFDQSESMKDDQHELRARIERIYAEIAKQPAAKGDAMLTAVTSFGERFHALTKKPTSDRDTIRQAIKSIPIDPSGKELTAQAVGKSVTLYRDMLRKEMRDMVLIVVTDESGDRESHDKFLEAAIATAKDARCRVFVLGREAGFDSPFRYFRWVHPATRQTHWIASDCGLACAFPEQLQTDGLRRRRDFLPSGFGPYHLTRLAEQTGGQFVMLPSVEFGRPVKRPELAAEYSPELKSPTEVLVQADDKPIRLALWSAIKDLNPYNRDRAKTVALRTQFSTKPAEFRLQIAKEQQKSTAYIALLDKVSKQLDEMAGDRMQETLRWRANYDLTRVQLDVFRLRVDEYLVAVSEFAADPPDVAPVKDGGKLLLARWEIVPGKATRTDSARERAPGVTKRLTSVIEAHPNTPWALRAKREIGQGFGVRIRPVYEPPKPAPRKPPPPLLSVPKL